MPRNGNGTFSFAASSWNPAINGNAATAPDWNALRTDIANGLTQSVSRDGQSPMTGNLPMGGNRIINLGQASDDNDALRRAQIIKGADIASSAALAVPIEGSLFDVTGTTAITSISDVYPGRIVVLRFMDTLTLTNSANLTLPSYSNIRTIPGGMGVFVNTEAGKWVCLSYNSFETDIDVWASQPIGVPIPIWDHLTGVPVPASDSIRYRYIKLTYQDGYNSGVLINETRTGSGDPFYQSTGQISLADSPLNGQTVRLINTERDFLRAGPSGSAETSAFASHSHTASSSSAGAHDHDYSYVRGDPGGGVAEGGDFALALTSGSTSTDGAHTHPITVNATGSNETRPRNVGATYYMRIL